MPELPEITVIAKQMNKEIAGKQIAEVEVKQPKNLNIAVSEFTETLVGKIVENISSRGKWIFVRLDPPYFMLINLGMGAELIYFSPNQNLPRARFHSRRWQTVTNTPGRVCKKDLSLNPLASTIFLTVAH